MDCHPKCRKRFFKKTCICRKTCVLFRQFNIKVIIKFKVTILSFIRLKGKSFFDIHDTNGIKLLNHLRLKFSHLNEHKFRHNFNDTVDSMCKYGLRPETTVHYLLRCNLYSDQRLELLNNVCVLNPSLKNYSNENLLNILLYGSEDFNCNMSKEKLKPIINF